MSDLGVECLVSEPEAERRDSSDPADDWFSIFGN